MDREMVMKKLFIRRRIWMNDEEMENASVKA